MDVEFRRFETADHDEESNAVLLNGAAGPIRIGAGTLESVPNVLHNSDHDDEQGNNSKILHPSKTVPASLPPTTKRFSNAPRSFVRRRAGVGIRSMGGCGAPVAAPHRTSFSPLETRCHRFVPLVRCWQWVEIPAGARMV